MGFTFDYKWAVVQTTPIGESVEGYCDTKMEALQLRMALKASYPDRDYAIKREAEYSM